MRLRRPGTLGHRAAMATTAPSVLGPVAPEPTRRGLTRDEVMTAIEVAELLHLPVSTVYYLARRGEIPACRLGRAWRFVRPRIEELLAG
jgi:excisionase family DNA binding protein